MAMNILLDTNIIIAFLKNDPGIVKKARSLHRINISVITVGELLYGALNSSKCDDNLAVFRNFFDECTLIPINAETAEEYAKIRLELKGKGTPIPENDLWIAATAKIHGYTLISRDIHLLKLKAIVRVDTW